MRFERIWRTRSSSALSVLAFRQFSTARPSAITPITKIVTPMSTSYKAKPADAGEMECWRAGVLTGALLHFSTTPLLLRCCLSRHITNKLAPGRQGRIIRRPQTVCALEIHDGGFAVSRWPENPFARRFFSQGRRQRKRQRLASGQGKRRQVFHFFVLAKGFRTKDGSLVAPNNEVG